MRITKKYNMRKSKRLRKISRRRKVKYGGSNIIDVVFTNDNNVLIKVDNTLKISQEYVHRVGAEQLFRKIVNYMIQNNHIDKNKNIIDLGAWIGDNSLPWAKNITGIVYAIDPSPNNCSFMKETLKINNITNVNVIQEIISDKEENLKIQAGNMNHGEFIRNNNGTNANKIKSKTLDSLYNENIISNIGFIHLDVEGMEYKIITGSKKLIEKDRPIVSYETHSRDNNIEDIKQYFISNNYTIFKIEEVCGVDASCRNSVAIPNSIVDKINLDDMYSKLSIDSKIFSKVT
jgi:FkbM family methyltransferase